MANVFTPSIATDVEAQKRVRKWIRALRSGDYEQGTSKLRRKEDSFCCLGVACDVVQPDGWANYEAERSYNPEDWTDWGHELGEGSESSSYGPITKLSREGLKLFRVASRGQQRLMNLNDSGGASFKTIAAKLAADLRARLAE